MHQPILKDILSPSAQKVQNTLLEQGFNIKVLEFIQTTKTSQDAADAVKCELGQIGKSIIFKGKVSCKPYLIVASGSNRINEKKIKAIVNENVTKADAEFVREHTGFAIGGIPPLAHTSKIDIIVDEDLMKYQEIWGAAGTPNAVFPLTPSELIKMTNGIVADIKV